MTEKLGRNNIQKFQGINAPRRIERHESRLFF